jgi:hypothetical protein
MTQDCDPCECLYDNPITMAREKWVNGKLISSSPMSTILHHAWYKQSESTASAPVFLNWFKSWEDYQVQGCPSGLPTMQNTTPLEFKTEEELDKLSDFGYLLCNEYFNHYGIPIQAFLCAYKVDRQAFLDVVIKDYDLSISLEKALCQFFNEPQGSLARLQTAEREWVKRMHQRAIEVAKGIEDGTIETIPWSQFQEQLNYDTNNPSSDS